MSYVYITATKNQCLTTVKIESSVEENPVLPVTQWSEVNMGPVLPVTQWSEVNKGPLVTVLPVTQWSDVNKGPLVTVFLVVDGVRSRFHDVGGQDLLPAGSPAAVEHADQCVQG